MNTKKNVIEEPRDTLAHMMLPDADPVKATAYVDGWLDFLAGKHNTLPQQITMEQ